MDRHGSIMTSMPYNGCDSGGGVGEHHNNSDIDNDSKHTSDTLKFTADLMKSYQANNRYSPGSSPLSSASPPSPCSPSVTKSAGSTGAPQPPPPLTLLNATPVPSVVSSKLLGANTPPPPPSLPSPNPYIAIHHTSTSRSSPLSYHSDPVDPFVLLKTDGQCADSKVKTKTKVTSLPTVNTNGWSPLNRPESGSLATSRRNCSPGDSGVHHNHHKLNNSADSRSHSTSPMPFGNEPLAQLLITLKEQNKSLIREIEDLRIKLEDAEGDLKLVRCQMRSMSKQMDTVEATTRAGMLDESILTELEFYKQKVMLLERDLQTLLDEKEELIIVRDDVQLKNERLNEHLVALMRNLSGQSTNYNDNSALSFDVDALYLENRYLKEKIKNQDDEKRLLLERLAKYKELMEQQQLHRPEMANKRYFGSTEGAIPTLQLPGGHVVDAHDIERLIATNSIHTMEVSKSNQMYLWNLLVALFEGLQTKNVNLVHARKTNRMLGKRVEDLESHWRTLDAKEHEQKLRKSPVRLLSGTDSSTASTTLNVANRLNDLHHHNHHPHQHLLVSDQLDETDGNASTPVTKDITTTTTNTTTTDEDDDDVQDDDEDDNERRKRNNDDLSSTGISTPSTARHHLSIEEHLQALQNDALVDDDDDVVVVTATSSHSKMDFKHSIHHRDIGLFDFKRDFDSTHQSQQTSLFN